ncbi:MAG: asparaginase [Acetobacteraceae bacterium]|nr:asparaginase [Acetobacteraceae bacterium]
MSKKKIAFIGTGGTISSLGAGPLDLHDYSMQNTRMEADAILKKFPDVQTVADVFPVHYRAIPSTEINFTDWKALVLLCDKLVADHSDLAGIVIGHGTATIEETAYFLSLTLKINIPVVITGAQRPASALSTDAGLNLVNAVRVAASPEARGMGVLVVLNDEIHAARDVTKSSTHRMQTFRSADFGALGHADGDAVVFYRRPTRCFYPDTEFDIRTVEILPRVDIALTYAGMDDTVVRALIAAGTRGIVSAGFAPGFPTPVEAAALGKASQQGIVVVQSTRAGSGRVFHSARLRAEKILVADNLLPQKARLLLALALTRTNDPSDIAGIFSTY